MLNVFLKTKSPTLILLKQIPSQGFNEHPFPSSATIPAASQFYLNRPSYTRPHVRYMFRNVVEKRKQARSTCWNRSKGKRQKTGNKYVKLVRYYIRTYSRKNQCTSLAGYCRERQFSCVCCVHSVAHVAMANSIISTVVLSAIRSRSSVDKERGMSQPQCIMYLIQLQNGVWTTKKHISVINVFETVQCTSCNNFPTRYALILSSTYSDKTINKESF